jgi:DNA-binding transcriptional LysR family regulator
MIQLHRLEGFYRVALAQGYARAAREFPYPITQPAVYQQVHKLEQDLGSRLFDRVSKDRVALTPAGRTLFDFCRPFFEQLPEVVRSIEASSHGGVLRVDSAALEIRHVMPAWLRRLRRARPDIRVELEEVQVADVARLRSGETDLIVEYLPNVPTGIATRKVACHHVFIVIPKDHPRARDARLSLKDLADEAFVGFHPSLPHHALQLAALEAAGSAPRERLSASSVEAILGFVQAGLGYSLIPWPDPVGPRLRGVIARRQKGPGTEFPVVAAWAPRGYPSPLVQAALDAL